jgi:hypothetical protein
MDENSIYLLRERMETHACILFSWKSHKEKAYMSEVLSKHSKCFGFATLMCSVKRPYPKPTLVNESTRLRRRENHVEGTRQTIPVP